jgi:hypothetical protein
MQRQNAAVLLRLAPLAVILVIVVTLVLVRMHETSESNSSNGLNRVALTAEDCVQIGTTLTQVPCNDLHTAQIIGLARGTDYSCDATELGSASPPADAGYSTYQFYDLNGDLTTACVIQTVPRTGSVFG